MKFLALCALMWVVYLPLMFFFTKADDLPRTIKGAGEFLVAVTIFSVVTAGIIWSFHFLLKYLMLS